MWSKCGQICTTFRATKIEKPPCRYLQSGLFVLGTGTKLSVTIVCFSCSFGSIQKNNSQFISFGKSVF